MRKHYEKIKKFMKEALYVGLAFLYFKMFGLGLGFLILIIFGLAIYIWVEVDKMEEGK